MSTYSILVDSNTFQQFRNNCEALDNFSEINSKFDPIDFYSEPELSLEEEPLYLDDYSMYEEELMCF